MISKANTIEMIAELSEAKGVSGFEDEVVSLLNRRGEVFGTLKRDSLLNLYLERKNNKGNHPVVLLDAHTDEVGFMVQAIRPNGTLQIIPLGSWVAHNVPAHRVWVRNAEGRYLPGITCSKPPHFMTDTEIKSAIELKHIMVDVGAISREDAINNYKVRIGEPVVPDVKFEYIEEHDLMIGKAFDNRLGCASILSTLSELGNDELKVDLVAAFATQEEVGARGSVVTSRMVKPELAIVFEGAPADDTFVDGFEVQTRMKQGPMLRHIDQKMITNPRFQRYALDMGAERGIPVQEAVRGAGSTNSAAIHLSNAGVPTIVIGLPVRYAHTHYAYASYEDYRNGVRLACEILRNLEEAVIKSF